MVGPWGSKGVGVKHFVLLLALAVAAPQTATAKPPRPPATAPATTARVPAAPGALVAPAMVSAADPRAAAAGVAMLRQGGSAMDAIAATLLALTVVEPQSSGIGGGGLLVYQAAGAADPVTFDGRETAPASASPALFLTPDGKPQPRSTAIPGGRSVGVPGNVAMLALAHARLGKLPWAALFAPAIALAENGYIVTPRMAAGIAAKRDVLARSPAAAALYLNADGSAKTARTRIVNAALAATLRAIAAGGPAAFYRGPVAADIAQTVGSAPTNPTVLTAADLTGYHAKARPPVCTSYRVWRVCGMGPPSSGGTSVAAILKQLERFDLAALGVDSPVSWHLLAESERLAFADRDAYLGDSDFVAVPVAGLVDPAYLASRGALIHADGTMASASAGTPPGAAPRAASPASEIPSTSSFAAADARGNVATLTSTVEGGFGSGLVSGGFVLNNELTDFSFVPSANGGPVANRVDAGKRPLSSMSPTLVYDRSGRVVLAIGAAGGPTIPAQVAKAIIGVLDWHLAVQDAIALPVIMVFGDLLLVESGPQGARLAAMLPALKALGHARTAVVALPYKANGLERVGSGTAAMWRGGADPRSEGVALGL